MIGGQQQLPADLGTEWQTDNRLVLFETANQHGSPLPNATQLERSPGTKIDPASESPSSLQENPMHVGVDVAKQHLDWAEGPDAPVQRVSYDPGGIRWEAP